MTARPRRALVTTAALPTIRPSLRLDFADGLRLGPGKIELLEAIIATGSISAAGRAMKMSYRRAWLLVDAVNQMFETPVVIATIGGPSGGGAAVTPLGRELVAAYRGIEQRLARETDSAFGALKEKTRKAHP